VQFILYKGDLLVCMYLLNYFHLIGYIFIFVLSYYSTYAYTSWCLVSSIPLGWSLFALVTIGHDCIHGSFSPYPLVNTVLSYVCLNGILMPRSVWQEEHQLHHSNPGCPEDTMILDGDSVLGEIRYLLCQKRNTYFLGEICKVPLVAALLCLPLYCIPLIWCTTLFSFAYLGLTTHILDPDIRTLDHDKPKDPHEIAWNILPKSHFYCFLAGGLNIHGCHHTNPRWTRSQLMHEASAEYMTINTVYELWNLVKDRNLHT